MFCDLQRRITAVLNSEGSALLRLPMQEIVGGKLVKRFRNVVHLRPSMLTDVLSRECCSTVCKACLTALQPNDRLVLSPHGTPYGIVTTPPPTPTQQTLDAEDASDASSADDFITGDEETNDLLQSGQFFTDPQPLDVADVYSSDSSVNEPPGYFDEFRDATRKVPLSFVVPPDRCPTPMTRGPTIHGHILLNAELGLLRRRSKPIQHHATSSAFLQTLCSRALPNGCPLMYPEGALFSSLCWHSHDDGSIDGSLPAPFWERQSRDGFQSGVASLQEHLWTRLNDGSLLSASDPRFLEFYFAVIVNTTLNSKDTRLVMRRGVEAIASGLARQYFRGPRGQLGFDQQESRERIDELSTLMADAEPTFFLTYTCSQRHHFGNLPHAHCLLWLRPGVDKQSEEVTQNICSTSSSLAARSDVLRRLGVLRPHETEEDLVDLGRRLLTHSCSKANYRCQRDTRTGGKRCRVAKGPISGDYWMETIDPGHSQEAIRVLLACGLGAMVNGQFIPVPELVAGKRWFIAYELRSRFFSP
ncbi:hypothetical protein FOZ60_014747 [Perkinsus olseni]|uniref:Uncharacterized protein n=1 Tax=Perkinsus olseni TaxID=32597 RepID=A0A7J6N736_PEROL|nr:hypothetical protein FOZ60_014747 [Perkinsus olseni]